MSTVSSASVQHVLVAHPNRQHSHQLALALHQAGLLASYWTGVPAKPAADATWAEQLMAWFSDNDALPIPAESIRHHYIEPVTNNIVRRLVPRERAVYWSHRASAWFDAWCARQVPTTEANVVVAYENAALRTFQAAKRQGMYTVLDAASFHHAWQDRFYDYIEPPDVHAEITARKDAEIELADHIFTVSDLAQQSYLDAGVPEDRVTAIPMGCDLSRFSRPADDAEDAPEQERSSERPTFIFVGHVGRRKGIDLLIEASSSIQDEYPHRVMVVGGGRATVDWSQYPWMTATGRVHQEEVAQHLQAADCFVLPSRHDSFGMVVVEAMASGLPVIVSDHVGAKEAVTDGQTGWIVPADRAHALADRMRWGIQHRNELAAMGQRAAPAAHAYDWSAYHQRAVDALRALGENRSTTGPTEDSPARSSSKSSSEEA